MIYDYKKPSATPEPPSWISQRYRDIHEKKEQEARIKYLKATDYGQPASFEDFVNSFVFGLCGVVFLIVLYVAQDHDWRLLHMIGLL